jgi:hypothetical protein
MLCAWAGGCAPVSIATAIANAAKDPVPFIISTPSDVVGDRAEVMGEVAYPDFCAVNFFSQTPCEPVGPESQPPMIL